MIALLVALLAQGVSSAEHIDRPPLPDFVVGYSAKNEQQSIVEQVPRGETVQEWTRMVTTQKFVGMVSSGLDVQAFVGRVAQGWVQACPQASAANADADAGRAGGVVWASIRLNCPRNPVTGKPETMFMRAFGGATDGYSVQVAFRRVPGVADAAWARDYLNKTRLCGGGAGC